MTPAQRALRSRMASHLSWAQTEDRPARTAPARRNSPVSVEYHLARVPEEITDPEARMKAARSAHKAYMTGLALKSSQARARKKTA